MEISYLPEGKIDKKKWDNCIDNTSNGLIYAYSFYLDAMSENWDAVVVNDYEMVLPLTWKKKYGIYYLYQPPFTASLGVFGNNISKETLKNLLEKIPQKFRYWDFYLNHTNLYSIPEFPMYERSNFVLLLSEDYETIKSKYASSTSRNIKRAIRFGNVVKKDIPLADVIQLSKEQAGKFSIIEEKRYSNLARLFYFLKEKNKAITYGVYSPQKKLVASCAYFFSHNRAYYILVGNHPDGKTSGASHLMIDAFVQDHAGQNLILDFEGSNIPGLAFFYKSFGAVLEKYPGIRMNKLKGIARLLKQ